MTSHISYAPSPTSKPPSRSDLVHIAHALADRPGNGTLPSIDMEMMGEFELWDHTGDWIAAAEELEFAAANR